MPQHIVLSYIGKSLGAVIGCFSLLLWARKKEAVIVTTSYSLIFIMSFTGYYFDILQFINVIYKAVCFVYPS